jgi:hypothetical protein
MKNNPKTTPLTKKEKFEKQKKEFLKWQLKISLKQNRQ